MEAKKRGQMTNPMRGQVQLDIGKETYKARLTIDAILQIEETCGKGIMKLATSMSEGDISMKDIIYILTPALRGGGMDINENAVKKIVADVGIVECTRAVATLLTATLTTESDETGEDSTEKKE